MFRQATFQSPTELAALGKDRQGTVALEFAILATALFILVFGAMEVGYDLYVEAALSNAVHTAARSIQVGIAQGSASGASEIAWVKSSVCPALGGRLDCGQLYVSVSTIPSGVGQNYYTYLMANPPSLTAMTSTADSICTGAAAQMMILQAYYLSPTFLGLLVPGWSQVSPVNTGARVHVTYAASGFVNEYFTGGETGC